MPDARCPGCRDPGGPVLRADRSSPAQTSDRRPPTSSAAPPRVDRRTTGRARHQVLTCQHRMRPEVPSPPGLVRSHADHVAQPSNRCPASRRSCRREQRARHRRGGQRTDRRSAHGSGRAWTPPHARANGRASTRQRRLDPMDRNCDAAARRRRWGPPRRLACRSLVPRAAGCQSTSTNRPSCPSVASTTCASCPPLAGLPARTAADSRRCPAARCPVPRPCRLPSLVCFTCSIRVARHPAGPQRTMATPKGWPKAKDVRRRPTLPRSLPRSTIGADGLSFRVRNGTGRFPVAMAAVTLWRCSRQRRPSLEICTVDAEYLFSRRGVAASG